MLTEKSLCEKTNKRRHSVVSKKLKYAELDSNDEDKDDDEDDDSENKCKYSI